MTVPEESSSEEFAEAIGRAVMAWQPVETQCAYTFLQLMVSKSAGAMSVFYYIKNFSTRLETMNIAARFLFYGHGRKRLANEWGRLSQRLQAGSNLRNRIAHYAINESITAIGWKFTLGPPEFDWSQLDPRDPYRWGKRQSQRVLTYSQIRSAEKEFSNLTSALERFSMRVTRLNGKQEPPPIGAKELPHARELDSGHLALVAHRPPGSPRLDISKAPSRKKKGPSKRRPVPT